MSDSTTADRVCEYCGVTFSVPISHLRRGIKRPAKFCSQACNGLSRKTPIEERFAKLLSEPTATGCILWTGLRDRKGYGLIHISDGGIKSNKQAHRLAWEIAHGEIPSGLCVLHKCDNPPCVNIEHLFIGTTLDNSRDMVAKGRCWKSKLTPGQVREIRIKAQPGVMMKTLAKEYGVTPGTISNIVHKKTWVWV